MIETFDFDNPITGSLSEYDKAKQIYTEGMEERVGEWKTGWEQTERVIQGKWRETEASPVTICSLLESINPTICVMHTVLLLPLHQRSSVLTHTHIDQYTDIHIHRRTRHT